MPLTKTSQHVEWYGQVLDQNVYLYRTPTDIIQDNVYFIVEPTYFVKLIDNANDKFYKAEYLDIACYVKKNEVQVVSSTPDTPFLVNINFRVFSNSSQQMRSIPATSGGSSTQVAYLPIFCKDAVYYGKIYGESAIEGRTNVWYFCKYTLDKTYYGYIYSDGCDQMTAIKKNTGTYDYVEAPDFNLKIENENLSVVSKSSPEYKYLIVLISIPVALFLFMIVRSNIILKISKKEKAKEVKLFDPNL